MINLPGAMAASGAMGTGCTWPSEQRRNEYGLRMLRESPVQGVMCEGVMCVCVCVGGGEGG